MHDTEWTQKISFFYFILHIIYGWKNQPSAKAEKEIKSPVEIKKLKDIHIIDSSMICIGKKLAPELYYQE